MHSNKTTDLAAALDALERQATARKVRAAARTALERRVAELRAEREARLARTARRMLGLEKSVSRSCKQTGSQDEPVACKASSNGR